MIAAASPSYVLIERRPDGERSLIATGSPADVAVTLLRRCDDEVLQKFKVSTISRIQQEHQLATGIIPPPPAKSESHQPVQ